MTKTLLLVDDHPLFRRGVRELIINQSRFYDTVIEADNGTDALAQIERYSPDTVVLDIAMPGIDGLATLEIIKQKFPTIKCIVLTMYDNSEFVVQARSKGANAYILKTDPDSIILDCLYSLEHGQHYISSTINNGSELRLPEIQIHAEDFQRLSDREKEILALIARNHTSKEIAAQLELSLRTVQNHRVNICRKLRITGSNALLKIAIENQAWL